MSEVWLFALLSLAHLSIAQQPRGMSYVVDEWGEINLPYLTYFCQEGLPIESYITYTCLGDDAEKELFDNSVCVAEEEEEEDSDKEQDGNPDTLDSDEASIRQIDCQVLADAEGTLEERPSLILDIGCHFAPPARRRLYLATDRCFLLSDQSFNDTEVQSSTQWYARLSCITDDDDIVFKTELFKNDDKCDDGSATEDYVVIKITQGSCGDWLTPQYTGFPYTLAAEIAFCDQSSSIHMCVIASHVVAIVFSIFMLR